MWLWFNSTKDKTNYLLCKPKTPGRAHVMDTSICRGILFLYIIYVQKISSTRNFCFVWFQEDTLKSTFQNEITVGTWLTYDMLATEFGILEIFILPRGNLKYRVVLVFRILFCCMDFILHSPRALSVEVYLKDRVVLTLWISKIPGRAHAVDI